MYSKTKKIEKARDGRVNPKMKSDRLKFITTPFCACLANNVRCDLNLQLTLICTQKLLSFFLEITRYI